MNNKEFLRDENDKNTINATITTTAFIFFIDTASLSIK